MTGRTVVYRIARANFLERVRRSSFMVAVAVTVMLGYLFLPPRDGNYATLIFGDHYVGVFNSAWMGTAMAISVEVFFTLIAFYLVSNAIKLDGDTKVSQIIMSSSVSKLNYLLGKFWSNYMLLAIITCVAMITAIIMQLVRGESYQVELWAYLAPFLFLILPLMAVVSAVALVFEIIPWLRSTFGTVLFFFLWMFSIVGFTGSAVGSGTITFTDPYGLKIAFQSITSALNAQYPGYDGQFSIGIITDTDMQTFAWNGIHWTIPAVIGRLAWIVAALGIVWLASYLFRRSNMEQVRKSRSRKHRKWMKAPVEPTLAAISTPVSLTRLQAKRRVHYLPMLWAELKLTYAGLRWWYVALIPAVILSLTLPLNAVEEFVWPLALIWPLAIWSQIGSREKQNRTEELIYSSPRPIRRLLFSSWLAGVSLGVLMTAGIAARFILAGHSTWLFAWLVAVVFIPSLALALGVWSNTGRMFQVIYLMLWYIGPLNKLAELNFLRVDSLAITTAYLAATVVLCVIAFAGRRRRIQTS